MRRLVRVACSLDSLPSSLGSRKFGQMEPIGGKRCPTGAEQRVTGTSKSWSAILEYVAESIQPRRWVIERTFGWLSRSRRLSKDYERKVQTSETLLHLAMIHLLVARLARSI